MAADVDKIVLLPRFTSLSGAMEYATAPVNVRQYSSANMSVWKGMTIGGGTPTFSVQVEKSPDLVIWTSEGTPFTPADEQEVAQAFAALETEWLRLKITITGGAPDPGYTCWAVGDFDKRSGA